MTEPELDARYKVREGVLHAGVAQLLSKNMITQDAEGSLRITAQGSEAMEALVEARRVSLEELLEGWDPSEHPELETLVRRLAVSVMADDDRLLKAALPSTS